MNRVDIRDDYKDLSEHVAQQIAHLVRDKPNAVLGLATGSTPKGVYERLVAMHENDGLDFSRVTCFNLDEYYPLSSDHPQSYNHFMATRLFDHINCPSHFMPKGRPRSAAQIRFDCQFYEARITKAGGIDLQLLGIGRGGHIGFNEIGSTASTRTRLATLAETTREDAAENFGGIENVPHQAITMGIKTILEARKIILMAAGDSKSAIVHQSMTERPSEKIPATFLQLHDNVAYCLDRAAAADYMRAQMQGRFSGLRALRTLTNAS